MEFVTKLITGRQQGERYIGYDKNELSSCIKPHNRIDINCLDKEQMHTKVKDLNAYINNKERIDRMIDFYTHCKERNLYEKTDLLCDQQSGICFHITKADEIRKLCDGKNYQKGAAYKSIYMERYPNNRFNLYMRYFLGIS